jgi:hypothetical protein
MVARLPPLELRGTIVSRPAAEPPERSGHRALDCRGSGYFLIVFGFGPVTWVRSARV